MEIKRLIMLIVTIFSTDLFSSQTQFSGNIAYDLKLKPQSKWGLYQFVSWNQSSGVQWGEVAKSKSYITGVSSIDASSAIKESIWSNTTMVRGFSQTNGPAYCSIDYNQNIFIDNSVSTGSTNIFLLAPAATDNEYDKPNNSSSGSGGAITVFGGGACNTVRFNGYSYCLIDNISKGSNPLFGYASCMIANGSGLKIDVVNATTVALFGQNYNIIDYFNEGVFFVYFNSTLGISPAGNNW